MSEWSHLPNAIHIDRLLTSLKANPEKWNAVWDLAWDATWDFARGAAFNAACDAVAWSEAFTAVWKAAREVAVPNTAWSAIVALIAWEDCAHLLNSEPEHVKLLAALGVESAILLYPACLIFSKEKELA